MAAINPSSSASSSRIPLSPSSSSLPKTPERMHLAVNGIFQSLKSLGMTPDSLNSLAGKEWIANIEKNIDKIEGLYSSILKGEAPGDSKLTLAALKDVENYFGGVSAEVKLHQSRGEGRVVNDLLVKMQSVKGRIAELNDFAAKFQSLDVIHAKLLGTLTQWYKEKEGLRSFSPADHNFASYQEAMNDFSNILALQRLAEKFNAPLKTVWLKKINELSSLVLTAQRNFSYALHTSMQMELDTAKRQLDKASDAFWKTSESASLDETIRAFEHYQESIAVVKFLEKEYIKALNMYTHLEDLLPKIQALYVTLPTGSKLSMLMSTVVTQTRWHLGLAKSSETLEKAELALQQGQIAHIVTDMQTWIEKDVQMIMGQLANVRNLIDIEDVSQCEHFLLNEVSESPEDVQAFIRKLEQRLVQANSMQAKSASTEVKHRVVSSKSLAPNSRPFDEQEFDNFVSEFNVAFLLREKIPPTEKVSKAITGLCAKIVEFHRKGGLGIDYDQTPIGEIYLQHVSKRWARFMPLEVASTSGWEVKEPAERITKVKLADSEELAWKKLKAGLLLRLIKFQTKELEANVIEKMEDDVRETPYEAAFRVKSTMVNAFGVKFLKNLKYMDHIIYPITPEESSPEETK